MNRTLLFFRSFGKALLFTLISLNYAQPIWAASPTAVPTPVPTATNLPLVDCGEVFSTASPKQCTCESGVQPGALPTDSCCGWFKDGKCFNNSYYLEGSLGNSVTQKTIDELNPLVQENSPYKDQFKTPGGFLNRVMFFAFPIAGLILFVMIVFGGFQMLTGAANKKNIDEGKQRVTAAIIGFLLLFSAYWLIQIVELIFGVKILG